MLPGLERWPLPPPLLFHQAPSFFLLLLFSTPSPVPHFSLHRHPRGEVGARLGALPRRIGQTLPAKEWPCCPAAVSHPLPRSTDGEWRTMLHLPRPPPRLTPPPFPALPLLLLKSFSQVSKWNQGTRGSLRVTVIIFIAMARPHAEKATHKILLKPRKSPSLQMRRLRSREDEGPVQVIQ